MQKVLTTPASIWAVPRYSYEITEQDPRTHEYKMYVGDTEPYKRGAIKVRDTFVEVDYVPLTQEELVTGEVAALEEVIKKTKAEAAQEIAFVQQRIAELLALPAPQ